MTWVWENSRSRYGARLALLAIAFHGETAVKGTGELADKTGLSERAVQQAIRELIALGELAVEFRPGNVSRYRVLMPDRAPLPLPPPTKHDPVPLRTRLFVFGRDGRRCTQCGAADDLTIDHVFPRALGGTHDEANLQTLCRSCNSRKGARV